METIRRGTFETNSSSAHSITVMRKEDWERFKGGEVFITEKIKRYHSEDGYYNMTAQLITPEMFVDFEGLKKVIMEKFPEGSSYYEEAKKFCTFHSMEEAQEYIKNNDDDELYLDEFVNYEMGYEIGIYSSDEEIGWGMAHIAEGDLGVPIVSIDREICC